MQSVDAISERILYWLSLDTQVRALAERLLERFAVTVGDLPASAAHHHAESGGLYRHSVEVALKAFEEFEGDKMMERRPNGSVDSFRSFLDRPRWQYATFIAALCPGLRKLFDLEIRWKRETWCPPDEPYLQFARRTKTPVASWQLDLSGGDTRTQAASVHPVAYALRNHGATCATNRPQPRKSRIAETNMKTLIANQYGRVEWKATGDPLTLSVRAGTPRRQTIRFQTPTDSVEQQLRLLAILQRLGAASNVSKCVRPQKAETGDRAVAFDHTGEERDPVRHPRRAVIEKRYTFAVKQERESEICSDRAFVENHALVPKTAN